MSLILNIVPEWLQLVSLACCIGTLVCSLWVVEPARADVIGGDGLLGSTRRTLGVGVAVLFGANVLGLLVRSAEMSGRPITEVFSVIPVVLLRTHLGHVWLLKIAAVVALWIAALAGRRQCPSRPLQKIMLVCAIAVAAMNSASGHGSDAGDFSVAELMDWLHLLPALVWGGGLIVLCVEVLPRLVKHGERAAGSMAGVAARFSRIAGVAVACIIITAPYEGWVYGGSVEALWASRYGQTMLAKIVLFSSLLGLGAFNRYVSVPRLYEWAGTVAGRQDAPGFRPLERDSRGLLASTRFVRSVRLEAVLVTGVLLCAAVLRTEAPPRHSRHLGHDAATTRGGESARMVIRGTGGRTAARGCKVACASQ